MFIGRRESLVFLAGGGIAVTQAAVAGPTARPVFWRLRKDGATIYILGFSEAKDRSWLTPGISKAFDESREVWFEVPQPDPAAPPPQQQAPVSAQPPGYAERSLFEVLKPDLSARMLAAAQKYGVPRDSLEYTRPWRAYFVLNRAYLSRKGGGPMDIENFADVVLSRMAYASKKPIHSEFATGADAMAHFIEMPDAEASERLEFLLDYLDEDEAGQLPDRYDWIEGRANTRALDKMRARWPLLYQDEMVKRNIAWVERIEGFLAAGGTYFIVIGLQHTLGPDSIPAKLRAAGLTPEAI
jgi:uncharacterized protein YbaP (TraB family)